MRLKKVKAYKVIMPCGETFETTSPAQTKTLLSDFATYGLCRGHWILNSLV